MGSSPVARPLSSGSPTAMEAAKIGCQLWKGEGWTAEHEGARSDLVKDRLSSVLAHSCWLPARSEVLRDAVRAGAGPIMTTSSKGVRR